MAIRIAFVEGASWDSRMMNRFSKDFSALMEVLLAGTGNCAGSLFPVVG